MTSQPPCLPQLLLQRHPRLPTPLRLGPLPPWMLRLLLKLAQKRTRLRCWQAVAVQAAALVQAVALAQQQVSEPLC